MAVNMAINSIPYKCIWCLEDSSKATFTSESHVLPECVGNERQQVLPRGIVCDKCNQYFGNKVEPTLIDDPIFKEVVGILLLRDKEREFAYEHSSSGVHRDIHMDIKLSDYRVSVSTKYEIKGQPSKAFEDRNILPKSKVYDIKSLAILSRAVHKIAFESLAYSLFVKYDFTVVNLDLMKDVDIFAHSFDVIRRWVRYGEPNSTVRPILKFFTFGEIKNQKELYEWEFYFIHFKNWFGMEIHLYGDCSVVSLTSPNDKVQDDLINSLNQVNVNRQVFIVSNKMKLLK